LGYNPDEEETEAKKAGATKSDSSNTIAPTPISPPRGGYGSASHTREKSASEMERLGMGMGRLGFGQIGGKNAVVQKKAVGGFGSVGPIKASSSNGMFSVLGPLLLCSPLTLL
jgi:ADP-ribosylation factor GTPase-activating protein 2/3